MKIAILHNYLDNIGGAQVALFTLARELKADVYSTVVDQDAIATMGFDQEVKSIGWIPTNAPWRHQAAVARFRSLDLSQQYDAFIIAGDWALAASVRNSPSIWWCHTPSRELWDLYERTRATTVPWHKRRVYDAWVSYNRHLNRKHAKQVHTIVAGSHNAQARLQQFLAIDAPVIYPPVDTKSFHAGSNEGYWLSVNRLIHYKRIELQLEAWAKMPSRRLIIVGADEPARHFQKYKGKLMSSKPGNVEFLPPQSSSALRELYAHAEGFVTTSHDEDFGLTPLEAMASGTPVVAVNEGGYQETVVDGTTGYLITASANAVVEAVTKIAQAPNNYRAACQTRAAQFDTNQTVRQFEAVLATLPQTMPVLQK